MRKINSKNTINFTISIPINGDKIAKEIAKKRHLSRSKLIELLLRGEAIIDPIEWKQWETYYNITEEK